MLSRNLRSLLKGKTVPKVEPVENLELHRKAKDLEHDQRTAEPRSKVDFLETDFSSDEGEDSITEILTEEDERVEEETFLELPIDVYQTNTHVIIHSPVAGAKPEDINVSLKEDILVVTRRRLGDYLPRHAQESFLQECYWGEISRSVTLPVPVIAEKSEADLAHGVLTISIPKVRASQTKVIRVRGAGSQ